MKFQFQSNLHRRAFEGCVTSAKGTLTGDAACDLFRMGMEKVAIDWPGYYLKEIAIVAREFDSVLGTAALADEIEAYITAQTPQAVGNQNVRYYSLAGAGRFSEITEGDYEFVLRKAALVNNHQELKQPFNGIQYLGTAYFVLPTEG